MAEDIQGDPSQVQMIQDRKQVIFVWTDDKSDLGTVKDLKKLGADGIVYDRYLSNTFLRFMSFRYVEIRVECRIFIIVIF
jgi:glycerophosphoryl diester phosphodiesterase